MTEGRILIVEDDYDFAEALTEVLCLYGYQVDAVHTGEDAIELTRRKRFDVILMDIALPGLDGIESLQRIQARDPNVKALLMTGYITHHLCARAAGIEILTKPLYHEDLLQRIRRFLDQDR